MNRLADTAIRLDSPNHNPRLRWWEFPDGAVEGAMDNAYSILPEMHEQRLFCHYCGVERWPKTEKHTPQCVATLEGQFRLE